ncbi:myosin-VIIa-like isoform X2 [Mytilus edulis]|uniref:myosin-VIIa-like isoform X2 n=1 Tax=Mytilus edulis TaxID=6550 RepID=UPI0039F12F73
MAERRSKNISNISVTKERAVPSKISASAFDDDDRHFDTSLAADETSNRTSIKRGSTSTDIAELNPKFGTSTLSKSAPIAEKVAAALNEQANAEENGLTNGNGSTDRDSEGPSSIHSDEIASSSSSFELSDPSSSSSSWAKFAQTYFQTKGCHSYSCSSLQQPLLPKKDRSDHLASLASWVTILRIMGDLPDADVGDTLAVAGTAPAVVTTVREYFQKKYTKKDIEETQKRYSELFKDPAHSGVTSIPFLPERSGGMLDKVQYVTALGIYRPEIRDELYCQVCRQLTNNPSRNSTVRGWVLLSLFAGSFAPSERLAPSFLQFLKDSSPVFAEKVERLVRRTFISGTRGFPPSWLEFQAAKNGKPILIPIALMNNHRMLVTADSVTTVQELCHQICDRIGITDDSGFSVYITLMQRISCLGHGLHRIMDAVAECEQNTKQMGMRESSSAWRLYFRKEYFVPWHNAKLDEISTELVYHQVMRGISVGEYKCDKEEILVLMAAQRYFCESQDSFEPMNLTSFLNSWLPEESKKAKDMAFWEEQVKKAIKEEFPKGKKVTAESLRADIVTYAKDKWHSQFSRFYDASKVISPAMTLQNGIVGVNSKQIDIMDEKENARNHLTFLEIGTVSRTRNSTTITTLSGEEYVMHSNHSEDLHSHLTQFLEGLKRKSKYAVVVQDSSQLEGAIGVNVAKGDLVILDGPYENYIDADIITGMCKRTDKISVMPRDLLYILPTPDEPASDSMGMLTMQLKKDPTVFINLSASEKTEHTLEAYSKVHFRPTNDNTVTKVLKQVSFRKEKSATPWQFSKDPIKKPLLRKTAFKEELRSTSCRCFLSIQQYMGDAINKDRLAESDIVNNYIINPAIRSRHIREEVYCQLIKQLTNNPDKGSTEKGFKLLYFLTSTVSPSYELTQHCEAFLRGNKHKLAKICLDSLRRTKEDGCRRYPPHTREHESFSYTTQKISIQIRFPFGEQQTFDIEPTERVGSFRNMIANKLGLAVAEDYGIFFGLQDRGSNLYSSSLAVLINARETEYFMDALTHVERFWLRQPEPISPGTSSTTQKVDLTIFFMKKLWVDAVPGEEVLSDVEFHFPQEVPNYLRGYHKCKMEETVKLSSLLYTAQHGQDMTALKNLEKDQSFLIPQTMHGEKPGKEWKSLIESSLQNYNSLKSEDAKIEFLKILSTLPTYGSVFFEVKQRSVKTYPKNILLAVNKDGVIFLDASNKGILARYGYNKIPNWAYDENSFTLVVGESSSAVKIYLETNVGHNLDDIVMCYVAWMMNKHIKKRPSAAGVTVGESSC